MNHTVIDIADAEAAGCDMLPGKEGQDRAGRAFGIAEIEMPGRPFGPGGAERFIHFARRISAGQHEMKLAALPDRHLGRREDCVDGQPLERILVGSAMPTIRPGGLGTPFHRAIFRKIVRFIKLSL